MAGRGTQLAGRVVLRVGAWLIYPLYSPFVRSYQLARTGTELVRQIRQGMPPPDRDVADLIDRPAEVVTLLRRTRRYGRLALLLAIVFTVLSLWAWLWQGFLPVSPTCIRYMSMAVLFAAEFLRMSYANWVLRTASPGGFATFIADGRNLWPR